MIAKLFYDEKDYGVVIRLLSGHYVAPEEVERVYTRQLFLESLEEKEKAVLKKC